MPVTKQPKRVKSPRPLTNEVIAQAALSILHCEGPEAVSFRRVAEVVGTSHVTVYRYCGSYEGMLDVCADHIAAGVPEIADDGDWTTATQMRFEAAYRMWSENADLILLMRGRAWLGHNIVSRFYEPTMRALVRSGLSVQDAARLFSALYRLTIGSVISTRANQWTPWESRDAIERLGAAQFPTLLQVSREVDNSDVDALYRDTLERLIAGVSPKPAAETRRPRKKAG